MSTLSPTARLLQEMVRIPSVNPADNPGVERPGEGELAAHLKAHLEKLGAKARLEPVKPGRPNIVAVFPAQPRPKMRLLLAPHTDTVSVVGMTVEPFEGRISGGKLYGRGASDTKGPMAAMLVALEEWYAPYRKAGKKPGLEVTFAGLMGEEAGNTGAITLANQSKPFDFAIIGEPTSHQIVHAHNGVLWLKIESSGKARHASIATTADNAIYKLLPAIHYFEKLQDTVAGKKSPGISSVCVSLLKAGSKINISPASGIAHIDVRTLPHADIRKVEAYICQGLAKAAKGIRLDIMGSSHPLNTPAADPTIKRILPHTRGLASAPWFCDAAIFARKGIPSVAMGPGSISQAHTKDEWISLKELEEGKNRFLAILKELDPSCP